MKKRLLTAVAVLTTIFLLSASIVWAQSALVAKTGQTTCYNAAGTMISCAGTGQDGDLQKGVASPSPRFTDNGDGTVTDKLTGLMWAKDANIFGTKNWTDALSAVNNLSLGGEGCGTSYTGWHLPNVKELQSLIDFGNYIPALPSGHPFSNVQSSFYWSSTTHAGNTAYAWYVSMASGIVASNGFKTNYYYVWPVRSAD
jgi:hypothetical protein